MQFNSSVQMALEAIQQWQSDPKKHINETVRNILDNERTIQELFGPDILKAPYGVAGFPHTPYYTYGYQNYFMAYALYPEVMEKLFKVQADYCALHNQGVARAYAEGGLPPFLRLDFDIADSRGTLVDVKSLDNIWFPHFARSLAPLLATNVKMIWHCDGKWCRACWKSDSKASRASSMRTAWITRKSAR